MIDGISPASRRLVPDGSRKPKENETMNIRVVEDLTRLAAIAAEQNETEATRKILLTVQALVAEWLAGIERHERKRR